MTTFKRWSREVVVGSLFSGIGGLDIGLEYAGMEIAWQCEIDPFCQSVLDQRFPKVPLYKDIREIDEATPRVDLIAGGFPCQPVSVAGLRKAQADERWLWPEFARVVGVLRPSYVLVENVPGLATRGLADVVGSLSEFGYVAEWNVVSAASAGAPHLRKRIFVIAYAVGDWFWKQPRGALADPESERLPARHGRVYGHQGKAESHREAALEVATAAGTSLHQGWATEPSVGRVAHGVPDRVDRIKSLGNSVVPQVGEFVGKLIMEAERTQLHLLEAA